MNTGNVPANKVYPFEQMVVGDSFLVPKKKANAAIVCACQYVNKMFNKKGRYLKFTSRTVKGGTRVWRIK